MGAPPSDSGAFHDKLTELFLIFDGKGVPGFPGTSTTANIMTWNWVVYVGNIIHVWPITKKILKSLLNQCTNVNSHKVMNKFCCDLHRLKIL